MTHSRTFAVPSWGTDIVGARVAGSVQSAPPADRLAFAQALFAAGHEAHLDIIIKPDGTHGGVTPDEARAVRASSPDLAMDLHLILQSGLSPVQQGTAVDETIALAREVGAGRLSAASSVLAERPDSIATLRAAGVDVWAEYGPADSTVDLGFDGVLVMLIPPGTSERADPARMDAVRRVAELIPTGVDGGITPELAIACVAAGAQVIVSGRALLGPADNG